MLNNWPIKTNYGNNLISANIVRIVATHTPLTAAIPTEFIPSPRPIEKLSLRSTHQLYDEIKTPLCFKSNRTVAVSLNIERYELRRKIGGNNFSA